MRRSEKTHLSKQKRGIYYYQLRKPRHPHCGPGTMGSRELWEETEDAKAKLGWAIHSHEASAKSQAESPEEVKVCEQDVDQSSFGTVYVGCFVLKGWGSPADIYSRF